ncbi:tetratricopeptide repeat protein [Buchananella hordeovulneris]|uniref:tetratricopeptide repeat protein n=1 Tax=Buchananella hordeovulneris TaxID=52770 RepID=UPI000F5E9B46|nr:tetratricopeptide repeat protein [Buchananella hordeovulneris]RRD42086.1 tetratricopeptide repeat protein [Buchananella hordeovulneris]RRD50380.1 tetratricopeptide repeat protein [Buchananella hordeovulneris]
MSSTWQIDPTTLQPVILDPAGFRAEFRADPYLPVIEALWGGRAAEALAHLEPQDASFRARVLRAECLAANGNTPQAEQMLLALLREEAGSPREAVLHQHYGKLLFRAARYRQALTEFRHALRLRQQAQAPPDQLASSRLAVERTTELLATARPTD